MKEPWLEYIIRFGDMEALEESFVKFREALKDAGFKEEELHSISSAPVEVFMMRDNLVQRIQDSKDQIKKYGMWTDEVKRNFDSYIARKLSKLEKKYPL